MRYATVTTAEGPLYGIVTDDGFIALSPDFPQWQTLTDGDPRGRAARSCPRRDGPHRHPRKRHLHP